MKHERNIYPVTAGQLGILLAYPTGTVVRDASGCIWGKKWHLWQRFGSLGDYDSTAIVWPCEVLWSPEPFSGTVEACSLSVWLAAVVLLLLAVLVAASVFTMANSAWLRDAVSWARMQRTTLIGAT